MILKTIKKEELLTDLVCMNLIKRKIFNEYLLTHNDEQLILLIFKDYAKVLKEVLHDELY